MYFCATKLKKQKQKQKNHTFFFVFTEIFIFQSPKNKIHKNNNIYSSREKKNVFKALSM